MKKPKLRTVAAKAKKRTATILARANETESGEEMSLVDESENE